MRTFSFLAACMCFFQVLQAQAWQYQGSRNFNWNSAQATWDTISRTNHAWDPVTGQIETELTETYNGTWTLGYRTTWQYNAAGQITKYNIDYPVGSSWQPLFQEDLEYDNMGNFVQSVWQDTSSGSLDSSRRSTITYNAAGQQTGRAFEVYDSPSSQWNWLYKNEYSYGTAAGWMEDLRLDWDNGTWDSTSRRTNVLWNDFTNYQFDSYSN